LLPKFITYVIVSPTLFSTAVLFSCCKLYREKSLWEEKVKAVEERAKQREDTARRLEVELEHRIRDEVEKYDKL